MVDEPTESPSLRDGLVWDGHEWTEGDLAWQGGTWVPTDEPRGEIVNNQTWLEKLRPIDRGLLLSALFALLSCLGALVFEVVRIQWVPQSASAENFGKGVEICLAVAAAFAIAFLVLAIIRVVGALAARRK